MKHVKALAAATALLFGLVHFAAASGAAADGYATISLLDATATFLQTGDTAWTLSKTGTVDSSSVTWTITATQGATTSGHLIVDGIMAVTNTGSADATIGNIVANLQTRQGHSWVTRSSDVADATNGDAATTAPVDPHGSSENQSSFSENAASGELKFMDAGTNTMFSLVPQKTIAPGETVNLLFAASFDNNALGLPVNTPIRAEVIVSFGNAAPTPANGQSIDINGSGTMDTDEAWVRSVPVRLGATVPEETPANSNPTLTDSTGDIATTGTVTFSNATFDLGTTSGTVTVHYDGGTDGGTITNCAHLTGTGSSTDVGGLIFPDVDGVSLQACNTQTIGAETCTPGAPGCGWTDGDMTTYSQALWGEDPTTTNAAGLLFDNYATVYASTFGVVEVGLHGAAGFSMQFTSGSDVLAYLPASGPIAPLDSDLLDPTSSSAGEFGGDVLALRLNVDFSDAGVTASSAGLRFGDLTLCGFSSLSAINGLTVRQFLDDVNALLGGGSSVYDITSLDPVTVELNDAFVDSAASVFSQQHLFNGSCP